MKCGIDLGTMFSAIAFCDASIAEGRLTIEHVGLTVADGANQVRSALYFDNAGGITVGSGALTRIATEPEQVVQWIKRDMGEDTKRKLNGRDWSPPEISAEILKVLKTDAEAWLNDTLEGAIVCVPAWFGDRQRKATEEAARIAGIPLLELLAEPSAAALAVSMDKPDLVSNKDILVYDLGGGTFDVVLIRTRRGSSGRLSVDTLALAGDRKLGGHDWDEALARHLSERCLKDFGYDPSSSEDRREWYYLLDQVERYKREFSKGLKEVSISCDHRGHVLNVTLDEFNDVTEHLLNKTGLWVEKVLKEAEEKHKVKRDDVVVLLCGGSSKLPGVKPLLTKLVGHEPLHLPRTNPELLVVRGAAYAAHMAEGVAEERKPGEPVVVFKQKFKPVGVEIVAEAVGDDYRYENRIVLKAGTDAETKATDEFEIAEDNQTELEITLLEGDDPDPEKCERIGNLVIQGLPPGRKEGSLVDVTIWYDASGILHCEAKDRETGRAAKAEVQR